MASAERAGAAPIDVTALRAEFPQLARRVHDKPLIYFDSANTAQKPRRVIDAVTRYYTEFNANVARAVHTLGGEATERYEATRDKVQRLIHAAHRDEVVFTSGTTAAINLVAYAWLLPKLQPGDEIVVTVMEHHANIVPWQLVAERSGARVVPAPVRDDGTLDVDAAIALLGARTRLFCVAHVSNVLGTVNPLGTLIDAARARGVPVLVDGSQAVPHMKVDVQALGCDFYAFTGHKLFGPTGTGVLWARRDILAGMPPFMGGGEMIERVSFDGTTFARPPHRFEPGTPNIAGFVGLGAAIDWIEEIGIDRIAAREAELAARMKERLAAIDGLRLIGNAPERAPVFSFVIDGVHAHDLATLLDFEGVAVRSGQHCAHPLLQRFGVAATARVSLACYNTLEEIDAFAQAVERVRARLA
jgi:cysteine desulfurase/selenocysteine lyase